MTEAVITVPAYFNDRQRKATKRAGELAGLRVERLVNEPTAAALAYGIHQLDHGSQFLVFDLGGGTFDVSILEIFEGVIEVRSTTGDNHLGGEDFNDLIVEDMRARLGSHLGREAGRKELFLQRLRAAAERVRRALTVQDAARAEIVWDDRTYAYEITAEQFEEKAKALLAKLRDPVIRALRDADVQAEALNEIILVGGATRMPIVRRLVTRMFGRFPSATVNPDEVVAVGAAILGGLKVRDSALEEVVFTDVCPYSLGVDASERAANGRIRSGIFCPIIERSTVVPASRVKSFSTLHDSQRKVIFNVYQGESRRVAENILLGRIEIPVPPAAAGEISLECRFSYDINGLIEVDVSVPRTDERRQLVIVDDDGPSGEELRRQREALAALKTHPRDLDANRAVVARAARCYETTLGDVREHVGSILARFEAVLDGQDPREADLARNDLTASLDALEGKTFL